jgi:hypothetical protein
MSGIQFTAVKVECSEAIDWEIMWVQFDSMEQCRDDGDRTGPYLSFSVNFEFGREVSIEFHDGTDYDGARAVDVDLWRTRIVTVIKGGPTFEIGFDLTEQAFGELRYYLSVMLPKRAFRDHCLVDYGPPIPPVAKPEDEEE